MVRKGVLYTPPLATVLEGITRDAIFTLAGDLGIPYEERQITRDQLYIADEIFITGTAAELVGVRMVDTRQVGDGKVGPLTRAISSAFNQALHGQSQFSARWLDYVE
jgi:branched-chain amino acid aminotransferase